MKNKKALTKPLTKTEMKILIFKKVKEGMGYEEAKKQLQEEINRCIKNHEKVKKPEKKSFKEEHERTMQPLQEKF